MGTDQATDTEIGQRADALGACVITKDKKFRKLDEAGKALYVPRRLITVDDMNSRVPQLKFMLNVNQSKLAELISSDEPFSYLLDRFGGFSATQNH